MCPGAVTVPLIVVVTPLPGHATRLVQRPVHGGPLSGPASQPPHTLGVPPPPRVSGGVQGPQFTVPPQPSPMKPQFAPTAAHVVGTHGLPSTENESPHTLAMPPPPQICGAVHVPHDAMIPP